MNGMKKGINKVIFNRDTEKKETVNVNATPQKKEVIHEKNTHNKVERKLHQVITILELFQ